MELKYIALISLTVGFVILFVNFMLFYNKPDVFFTLNLLVAAIILGVPLGIRYFSYTKVKNVEKTFPIFLRDITTNINAGMTLPQAIKATERNDYKELNKHVKEIIAKMDWGISFERILEDFAKKVGSPILKRTVRTINETHRSGGNIGDVMIAVAESVQELDRIRRERSGSVYSQMINGYIIYFVFLGVMVGLSSFLVPAFQTQQTGLAVNPAIFKDMFRNLILIQGMFAGLAIGQMSEGSLMGGLKHSVVLTVVGYSVFLFAL